MRQRPPVDGPADHRLMLVAPVRAAAGLAPAGRRLGERGRPHRPFSPNRRPARPSWAAAQSDTRVTWESRVERRRAGPRVRPPWPCATGESGSPAKRRRSPPPLFPFPRPPAADGGKGREGTRCGVVTKMNPFTCHTRWQGSMLHPLLTHYGPWAADGPVRPRCNWQRRVRSPRGHGRSKVRPRANPWSVRVLAGSGRLQFHGVTSARLFELSRLPVGTLPPHSIGRGVRAGCGETRSRPSARVNPPRGRAGHRDRRG